MNIVTHEEARHWCGKHDLELDRPSWRDPRICNNVRFLTEGKQSIVEALIRNAVVYRQFEGALVWILDWPLYNPDEMAVIMRLRSSVGESRRLIDAPGHVFDANEVHDCTGLFNLCVQYFWDAFLYVPASGLLVFNSHDGLQYVSSTSDIDRDQLKADIKRYNLTVVK
jgi:hypothetical protein